MALGFLCIRHPGAPLTALVVLIGIVAIVFGAVEVIGAFSARHATKHWEAYKAAGATKPARHAAAAAGQFLAWRAVRPVPASCVGDEILDLSDPSTGLPPTMARPARPRPCRRWSRSVPREPGRRPATTGRRCGATRRCPTRRPSSPSA